MDTQEIRAKKRELENKLAHFVATSVNAFENETGVNVTSCDVFFIEIEEFGSEPPEAGTIVRYEPQPFPEELAERLKEIKEIRIESKPRKIVSQVTISVDI